MRYFFFFILYCSLYASSARVVTYNLLNFSDEDDREDDFITIIEYIQPAIIIAQEENLKCYWNQLVYACNMETIFPTFLI